jgi:hypothetical protein
MKLVEIIANAEDCEGTRSGATCTTCMPPRAALSFMRELVEERAERAQERRVKRRRVSPGSEYLDDGSMICPFGKLGLGACDYHTYPGCSWDA